MNLNQMTDRVYYHLRTGPAGVEEGYVEDWLNEAYVDVAVRLRLLQKTATGSTSGNTIALPSDLVELISLRVETTDFALVDDDVWNSWSDDESTPEEPYFARVFGANFELYPTPDAGDAYAIRYFYYPAALDTPDDVPLIPVEQHPRLVRYAIAQGKYLEGEIAEGDRFLAMYEDGLPSPPTSRSRLNPGPWTMAPMPGWYDEFDPNVAHL